MEPVQVNELPPVKIAIVIDDMIVETINTDNRIASMLLSNPTFVDLGDFNGIIGENAPIDLVNGTFIDVNGNQHTIS